MAISGSFYGTTSNTAIKPKISWSAESNLEGNYSDVTATLSYSRTDSYKTYGYWAGSLSINGDKKTFSGKYIEITYNSNTVTLTHTVRVPHADDGTMTVEITGSGNIAGTSLTNTAISGKAVLETIPRAASIGATDADIGSVSMVTIGKKSDRYTYTVAWEFGNLSGYLTPGGISEKAEHVTASSLSFPLTEEFYYEIPDKPTGSCTLTCTTYLKGIAIGTPQKTTFTVRADPARCGPLLTVSAEDICAQTLALTGNSGIFIRYASTAQCTMTAQAQYGASLSKRKIAGQTVSGNTRTLEKIDTDTVRFSVTDSRGYTAEKQCKLELVPYFLPELRLSAARTDATGGGAKLQISGSFFGGSFGSKDNSLKLEYGVDDGNLVAVQPDVDGNGFSLEYLLQDLDYTRAFTISVTASDELNSITVKTRINPGFPVFDWGKEDFAFHTPVSLSGNVLRNLADPVESRDAVNLGYARSAFASAGDYQKKCIAVTSVGTDLNQYLEDGTWYFGDSFTPKHLPVGSNGWLRVMRSQSGSQVMAKQFWNRQGTLETNDHQSYVRTYDSKTGWSSWTQCITQKDAYREVKLWKNASLSSSFPAQTIALDLSGYNGVSILYYVDATTNVHRITGRVGKNQNGCMWFVTASNGYRLHRVFAVSDTGITFNEATITGNVAVDKVCIPHVIYGIKGGI